MSTHSLPIWRTKKDNTLVTTVTCDNFLHAVHIINELTPIAEELQHHPNIELKDYNKLTIILTTHDAGNTITQKDYDLARKISTLYPNN